MDQNGSNCCAVRALDHRAFDKAYDSLILHNEFTEQSNYYHVYRERYRRTLAYLVERLPARQASILEIGGGQIALLSQALFNDRAIVGDVNRSYAQSVLKHGVEFIKCDLLRDTLSNHQQFDVLIMCEVVEHLPVPLYTVLHRLLPALKPGGQLLLTTPNLYRLRNVVRLACGRELFCPFFYPDESTSLGHVLEFSADHLQWQLGRAGLQDVHVEFAQLSNRGATWRTDLYRRFAAPMLRLRPSWRDGLVAWGRAPEAHRSAIQHNLFDETTLHPASREAHVPA